MEWRVVKARKLIGSKTEVSLGDVVVQLEPPEEGIVTVRTQQGEVGPLPLTCLGRTGSVTKIITMFPPSASAERQEMESVRQAQTDRDQGLGGGRRGGH